MLRNQKKNSNKNSTHFDDVALLHFVAAVVVVGVADADETAAADEAVDAVGAGLFIICTYKFVR